MPLDFTRWAASDHPNWRGPWLRATYTLPFVVLPVGFVLSLHGYLGSSALERVVEALTLAAMIAILLTFSSPFARHAATKSATSVRPYDEREFGILLKAESVSYYVLVVGLLAALGYGWLALRAGYWVPSTPDDVERLLRLAVLAITLRIVVAEWLAPLPEAEEDSA